MVVGFMVAAPFSLSLCRDWIDWTAAPISSVAASS